MHSDISKIRFATFIAVFIGITLLFLYTVQGLFAPIFFGAVFAIVLHPLAMKMTEWFKGRETLAIITTLLLSIAIFVSAAYGVGTLLLRDSLVLADSIGEQVKVISPQIDQLRGQANDALPPIVRDRLGAMDIQEQFVGFIQSASQALLNSARQFTANFLQALALSLITVYATYYFIKNGKRWAEHFFTIFPLSIHDERYLAGQFLAMVRTSLKMVFVMGAVQGFLGGLIFALLGITAPIFWGAVFAIFSLIPGLGHFIIWIPTAAILFLTGSPVKALILVIYSMFVLGFSDDILRPYLIGRSVHIHPFLILVATLGGIATFGFLGLILGPVVASLTLAVWKLFEEKYASAD